MTAMNWLQSHVLVNMERKRRCQAKLLTAALFSASFAAFCLSSPAAAGRVPACLPNVAGIGRAAKIEDNGVLVLDGHRTVRLEGLLWPTERDGVPSSVVTGSTAALRILIAGHRLVLRAKEPRLDRYDRLRVQAVLDDGRWLQQEVLRRGLARVSIAPDRPECARELYAAEAEARDARTGLWALSAYRVRTSNSLRWQDLGTFQIVEGAVVNARVSSGRAYLNFGRNWRTDFTVTIAPEDMKRFRAANVDAYSYSGKRVRVRGWIDRLHGFEIEAGSPAQIEVLQ